MLKRSMTDLMAGFEVHCALGLLATDERTGKKLDPSTLAFAPRLVLCFFFFFFLIFFFFKSINQGFSIRCKELHGLTLVVRRSVLGKFG